MSQLSLKCPHCRLIFYFNTRKVFWKILINCRQASNKSKFYTSSDIYISSFYNIARAFFFRCCIANDRILIVKYARPTTSCRMDISLPKENLRGSARTKCACNAHAYSVIALLCHCIDFTNIKSAM